MERKDEDEGESFRLRSYQAEMVNESLKRNIVVAVGVLDLLASDRVLTGTLDGHRER
jgi:hypothetical protein